MKKVIFVAQNGARIVVGKHISSQAGREFLYPSHTRTCKGCGADWVVLLSEEDGYCDCCHWRRSSQQLTLR